jgi:hypothetical protein
VNPSLSKVTRSAAKTVVEPLIRLMHFVASVAVLFAVTPSSPSVIATRELEETPNPHQGEAMGREVGPAVSPSAV